MLTRAMPLRQATLFACQIRPSRAISSTFAHLCTAARPRGPQQYQILIRQHHNASRSVPRLSSKRLNLLQTRKSSSSASQSSVAPSAASSSASAADQPLTWNRFLALRKTRRRISLVSSITCAAGGFATAVFIISTKDVESMGTQILGLDPIVVIGLSVLMGVGIGWLIGPFFGGTVFNTAYRSYRTQIAAKEKEFYARIKKFRVDPSTSSISNPVPDYYGEKIGSVAGYRRWLKDQRAFNLKRGKTA